MSTCWHAVAQQCLVKVLALQCCTVHCLNMPLCPARKLQPTSVSGCQLTVALQPAALNHYTSYYIQDCPLADSIDKTCVHNEDPAGVPLGPRAESTWLNVAPQGFR